MSGVAAAGGVDAEWLFKLRVVIARCGEMDLGRWWNSSKQLGAAGRTVLSRGLPRTHHFAQARCLAAIADQRCCQLLGDDRAITLWRLPASIEDAIERRWEGWIDDAAAWGVFFASVAALSKSNVANALKALDLVDAAELKAAAGLKRSVDERGVMVAKTFSGARRELALLALGFGAGSVNDPVVPFIPGRGG